MWGDVREDIVGRLRVLRRWRCTRQQKLNDTRSALSKYCPAGRPASLDKDDQADRAISTGKLHGSPHFHTRPINVVVYHGPQRSLVSRWVSRLDAFSGYPVHT